MRSAFFGLHVATSGLHTARGALNVTSHNISNAEIPGFSRQVAQKQAGRPLRGSGTGMYGTGSQITAVVQMRDRFLDRKFWNQNALSGRFTAINQSLNFVETVFNNVSPTGVTRNFNGFFSTIQDLTTRANEPAFRTGVVSSANSLAEQIRQNAFSLQRQQHDLNREFADVVHTINSLGNQIADLNRQIHIFERNGSHANDLRDQRALLIDRLSHLVNVEVEERDFSRPGAANDRRTHILINGQVFVNHTNTNLLELVPRNNPDVPGSGGFRNEMDLPGLYDARFQATGSFFNIHSQTLGGKLRGIVDVRDGNGGQVTLPPMQTGQYLLQTQLDALTRTLGFIGGMEAEFTGFLAELASWVSARTDALSAINATTASAPANPAAFPITTTFPIESAAAAREWLNELFALQSRRNGYENTISASRNTIAATIDVPGIRAIIGDSFLRDNPAIRDMVDDLQAIVSELADDDFDWTVADVNDFMTRTSDALDTLREALYDHPDFTNQNLLNTLANRANNMDNLVRPLRTAVDNLETLAPHPDLDAAIQFVIDAISDLDAATFQISEITTFANRLQTQLDWAVTNVEAMIRDLSVRVDDIEMGRAPGDINEYAAMQAILETQLTALRSIAEELDTVTAPSVYAPAAELTAFITGLQNTLNSTGGVTEFSNILEQIVGTPGTPGLVETTLSEGGFRNVPRTSNFKGIPFYMNQLNEMVRTFARAINEGRNRHGEAILNPVGRNPDGSNIYAPVTGHIFGYNANGENLRTLFFTFEGADGNPGVLDHDDPMQSLRLWILQDPDDPTRPWTINGEFVTATGPNPPANVAVDDNGHAMFTIDYSQFNALNFMVNPKLDNPTYLAASSREHIGQANNDIIHGFLAVWNDPRLFREGRLIDFIIATSSHLATDTRQSERFRESYNEILTQTHNHRLSVKGVDTEEEMMNLVRFQNMFRATTRLINVMDTVYDTLINRLGNF